MPIAWRIVAESRIVEAFSGDGAAKYGGRWNSPGVAVVYTSSSQSLAALETLVHLVPPVTRRFIIVPVTFPDSIVQVIRRAELQSGWKNEPPGYASQSVGDASFHERRSAVLQVPSAIVTAELNYVINPAHEDFRKIKIGKREPFEFDPRLIA